MREGVVVEYFNHILGLMAEFCDDRSDKNVPPPVLLLLLSKTCRDLQANTIHYILNYVDEQFFIDDTSGLATKTLVLNDFLFAFCEKNITLIDLPGEHINEPCPSFRPQQLTPTLI